MAGVSVKARVDTFMQLRRLHILAVFFTGGIVNGW
jgi:hypothetical protein